MINGYVVATDQNIYRFNGKTFSFFDPGNVRMHIQFNSIGFVKDRWLFFTSSKGVFIYKKETNQWKFAGRALEDYNINGVTVKHNKVWISTEEGLLFFR